MSTLYTQMLIVLSVRRLALCMTSCRMLPEIRERCRMPNVAEKKGKFKRSSDFVNIPVAWWERRLAHFASHLPASGYRMTASGVHCPADV